MGHGGTEEEDDEDDEWLMWRSGGRGGRGERGKRREYDATHGEKGKEGGVWHKRRGDREIRGMLSSGESEDEGGREKLKQVPTPLSHTLTLSPLPHTIRDWDPLSSSPLPEREGERGKK